MSLPDQLSRFIAAGPFAVMTRCVLQAMLNRSAIDDLFQQEAEQQYDRQIPFMAIVWTMAEIVLGTIPSRNQAHNAYRDQINASKTAYYNKLNRTEPKTSEALVRFSASKARSLMELLAFEPWSLLEGYQCFSIDGNHFRKSERRLKEARTLSAPPLPGSVVAKYDHQTGLFCDAYALECGHAQETTMVDQVIANASPKEVYLADRLYCIKRFLFGLMEANAYFIIRQKSSVSGQLKGRCKKIGQTETGDVFEQTIEITHGNSCKTIRRITIELYEPTRDGETVVHLLSSLPASTSALEIADAYRSRWEIETGFYHLTTTLDCEDKGNCHPRCAILQFCTAIVAYNARRLMVAAMYAVHQQDAVKAMSEYAISLDVTKHIEGLNVAINDDEWNSLVADAPASTAKFLKRVARTIDPANYKKSKRGPKKPPPDKKRMNRNSHLSSQKLLNQRKKKTR